jgi:hypothetical protein
VATGAADETGQPGLGGLSQHLDGVAVSHPMHCGGVEALAGSLRVNVRAMKVRGRWFRCGCGCHVAVFSSASWTRLPRARPP